MGVLLARFFIGGAVVSFFAIFGSTLRPRSFAGLFGASPSIALATLGLTIASQGRIYAAQETRTMLLGAGAFLVYAGLASVVLRGQRISALATAVMLLPAWLAVALGLEAWLRLS